MKGKTSDTVTVSGPAVEETKPSPATGISFAANCASHAAKHGIVTTYYVRDRDGEIVGAAESDGKTAFIMNAETFARRQAVTA